MEFRLTYQGLLPSNGSAQEKHLIRRQLHVQLKELWNQIPLSHHRDFLEFPHKDISVIRQLGGIDFAVLVCEQLKLYAEIDVVLLRPGPLGGLITKGGDIDNRLKTLFDALRYPKELQELPKGFAPSDDEKPFFCLLEDDQLITKISVSVDRLLVPSGSGDVHLLLHVKIRGSDVIWGNMSLIS